MNYRPKILSSGLLRAFPVIWVLSSGTPAGCGGNRKGKSYRDRFVPSSPSKLPVVEFPKTYREFVESSQPVCHDGPGNFPFRIYWYVEAPGDLPPDLRPTGRGDFRRISHGLQSPWKQRLCD